MPRARSSGTLSSRTPSLVYKPCDANGASPRAKQSASAASRYRRFRSTSPAYGLSTTTSLIPRRPFSESSALLGRGRLPLTSPFDHRAPEPLVQLWVVHQQPLEDVGIHRARLKHLGDRRDVAHATADQLREAHHLRRRDEDARLVALDRPV